MNTLSNLFRGKSDQEHYLALDIGTDVVKALIFRADKKAKKGFVIGVGKQKQKPGNMLGGGVANIEGVIATCRIALDIAMKKSKTKYIEKAIMGVAGELVKGTTTTVHYQRIRSDTKIDAAEMCEIMHQVQEKAKERIRSQIEWETGQNSIQIKFVNAAIVSMRIDGYKVTNPIGFQGTNVSISIFNAYAPLIHLGALGTIADELDIPSSNIIAEPFAVSRVLAIEDDRDFNAIFIDVGGGTTDIAVVRNGGLDGTKMYAIGGHSFTKHIAQELHISFDEAEKAKLAHVFGDTTWKHPKINLEDVASILREDVGIWLGGLELALSEFFKNDVLPGKIFLCGGGTALSEMFQILNDEEWKQSLFFPSNVEIKYLMPQDISLIEDETKELVSSQDVTPLALANNIIEAFSEERTLSNILRRTAKEIDI